MLGIGAELAPARIVGLTDDARLAYLSQQNLPIGWSDDSQRVVLRACIDLSQTLYARAQPTERRSRFLEGCIGTAKRTLANAPDFSEAWTVIAIANAQLGNVDAFLDALDKARSTAPHVQWLAAQRISLREANRPVLSEAEQEAQEADILTLMHSNEGALTLADLYLTNNSFKELLTRVAETAPQEEQVRLVYRIRDTASARQQ